MTVFDRNMKKVGSVADMELNVPSLNCAYVIVRASRSTSKEILGRLVAIRASKIKIPVSLVDKVKDAIILDCSSDELRSKVGKS